MSCKEEFFAAVNKCEGPGEESAPARWSQSSLECWVWSLQTTEQPCQTSATAFLENPCLWERGNREWAQMQMFSHPWKRSEGAAPSWCSQCLEQGEDTEIKSQMDPARLQWKGSEGSPEQRKFGCKSLKNILFSLFFFFLYFFPIFLYFPSFPHMKQLERVRNLLKFLWQILPLKTQTTPTPKQTPWFALGCVSWLHTMKRV